MHKDTEQFEIAKGIIESGEFTCVVVKNDEIIHKANGKGVAPLLNLYRGEKEKLHGAKVADKIIGKAAAMILHLGGADSVFGAVMSEHGKAYLEENDINPSYGELVEKITSRDGTGYCPIEKSVLEISDAHEGLEKIIETIAELMKKA